MPAFVLRFSPAKRYGTRRNKLRRFSFRVSLSSEQPSTRVSAGPAAGEEPAINQRLNTERFSAMNVSSDFGGAPPIF
jgi:hypothetical protein